MTSFRDSIFHRILEAELADFPDGTSHLGAHLEASLAFIRTLPAEKAGFAYAQSKWRLAEVLGHLLDTRVVFLNRLLYIARGERIALPGFDEQLWVREGAHANATLADLTALFAAGNDLVAGTVKILPAGWQHRAGTANGILITADEILLYMMAHEKHHLKVIANRYL